MKKNNVLYFLFSSFLLFFISINSAFGYTSNVDHEIHSLFDLNSSKKMKSTLSYPSGFLDGEIYTNDLGYSNEDGSLNYNNVPLGVGRAYWTRGIDDSNVDCSNDEIAKNTSKLENRKCFIRHAGMFTKVDISGYSTAFPNVNNLFQVRIDDDLKNEVDGNEGAFEFGLAGFGATYGKDSGLAGWGEVSQASGNGVNSQGAAIQAYLLDENGDEIDNIGLDIYAEGLNGELVNVTQTLGKKGIGNRKVVSSTNPLLFRGKCIGVNGSDKGGAEAYNNNNCKAFNMIFGLTPRLVIKKEDWSKSRMKGVTDGDGAKLNYTQIGFRILPVVKNNNGEIFEPSFMPNDQMGKVAMTNRRFSNAGGSWKEGNSGKSVGVMYDLITESGEKVGQVGEMSNWLSFLTTSSLYHTNDGIYKKGMNFNQFLSVLKANGDNITGVNSVLSQKTSEWLNYNGGFITHQMRRRVPTMTQLQNYEDERNKYVMGSSLGCLVGDSSFGCNGKTVSTKDFQVRNFLLKGKLREGDSNLYVITLDKDNVYSYESNQNARTGLGFASMNDERKSRIKEIHNKFSRNYYSDFKEYTSDLIEEFDKWRMNGVTSAYSFIEGAIGKIEQENRTLKTIVSKASDLHYGGKLKYVANDQVMKELNGVEASNNSGNDTNENREIVKLSSPINIKSGDGDGVDNMKIEFVNKNYIGDSNKFQYSIDKEGTVEDNFNSHKESIILKGFRHSQGEIGQIGKYFGYKKSGIGIYKIPVKDLLIRNGEREKFLQCEGEGENETCKLKKDYYFNYFISFSAGNNAIGYTMSSDFFVGGDNDPEDNTPIDLNIKLDNLCVFRKNAAEQDPKNAYYKLLNADNQCKDINIEHGFSATQPEGTDMFNYDWTNVKTKEDGIVKNPIEPLQAGQKAKMEINETNQCDLAFVGKVTASNLNLLHKEIKDLEIKLSNAPQNLELLNVADIDVGNKAVKFQSKKLSEPLDPSNPILNTLGLLQGPDTAASLKIFNEGTGVLTRKEAYKKIKIEACDGTVYKINGDSDEELLYLQQQARSKNGGVCQYSFEYAFRPISNLCPAMDMQEYGKAITTTKEVSIGLADENPQEITKEELQGDETCESNPEKCAKIKDYEPSRADITKNSQYQSVIPFKKMNIGNWGFKVNSMQLCTTKQDPNSMLNTTIDECSNVEPIGKKVVFAGVGINTEQTPSIRIRLYPNGQCVDYNKNGGVAGNGTAQTPGASTVTNKKSADIGGSCGKTMINCDTVGADGNRLCQVPVKVCLRNEDPRKRDLFRARIMGIAGNMNIIPGNELTDVNILHNQMNLGPNHFGTLKFGEEEKCSEVIMLEKESKICGEKVARVSMRGEADYNNVGDAGGISITSDKSIEWDWDIECAPPKDVCEETYGVEFCNPTDPNDRTPPRTPGTNPPPGNTPGGDDPFDPDNGNPTPPRIPGSNNPPIDSQCIHRGWTTEITRFFKNKNNYPIKNARIVYEIDKSSYVFSGNDFVRRKDGKYEKTFLNVFSESSTPISSIVIGVKDGVPSGTKIIVKETATFEMMDGTSHSIVTDREFMYGQGRPGEKCEPDSLRDFITLELPKTPIGEEPLDPDNGTPIPPRVPYENPGIPFNEVPSKDVPNDGGRIKNCTEHDGKAPSVNGKGGNYCSQNPGINNGGDSIGKISDVCAIYNPTAKAGLNGISSDQKTDGESQLPKELPVTRVIKANYYRVEADEKALKENGYRLNWNPGIDKFNLNKPFWGSILQVDRDDYTNGYRDLQENSTRMVYKDPYIDWTIELPCQVKLASEYFGSNDQGDERGSFRIIERNENRSYTTSEGNVCKQKVYKVRQFIKTKGSGYIDNYYETDQGEKFIDEVQKRIEGVSNPLDTEFKNSNVFRYITFAVTPDNEQGRQKIDVSKNSFDLNNYIKVTGQLGYKRITRAVVDEATTQTGKYNGESSCYRVENGWMTSGYRVYPRRGGSYCVYYRVKQLNYHRDKLVENVDIKTTAQGMNSSRIGGSSGYNSTYRNNYNDEHVSLKTEGNKALLLHDICNPGAALCVLGGDAYSKKGIALEKAVFDYRLPGEFSFISGGGIKLSEKTGESKSKEDKTIYGENVNFSFEDPTGTREDKIKNPRLYCDYVDSTGKINPELDSEQRCKTTYFEDLKTGRNGGVKKINQQKWTTDLNLSDPDNPTNPTSPQDYKVTSGKDIVWHVEGDLVIGDHPNKWLNVRGKGTVFVEGNLYINSNMQYVTNSVTDIKEAYKIDSAAFIVSGNIYIAPEVTTTVGVMAAMGPDSQFFSCGDTSKDKERGIDSGTSCTSRSPLLIQQLIARKINFDRLPSNVPLYVKKFVPGNKITGNNASPVCSTIGDSEADKKAHPECFVDKCIQAKNHLEDKIGCFEIVNQLTSSECLVNDNRIILNSPSALNFTNNKMKRVEIAPGESLNGSFTNQ